MLNNQKGIAPIVVLIILAAGLGVGLYLVQNPTVFKPKAYESTIISPCPNLTVTGIQAAFGSQRGDSRYNQCYDANNDGYVNIRDFSILRPQLSASPSPTPYVTPFYGTPSYGTPGYGTPSYSYPTPVQ